MSAKLFFEAIIKFLLGVVLVGILIFLPAGSFAYINGWILMGVLFIPMFIAGIVMMIKNPDLLRRRLDAKEKKKDQSTVVKLSGLMFIAGFIISGLGYRFGWLMLPKGIIIAGAAIFLFCYVLYAEVLRENSYLSRTITVHEGQTVVDSGLYGIVRHPMYSATIFLFLSIPLILGSIYAFIIFLVYPFIVIKRLLSEEILLENELEGYVEYENKVKWRLFPFIW